ncbi:exonuclease [Klebsiella phage NL_ZS_1]|uniref:Exonuclease n=4 Tax=root TaxID=1 RepID=A0A3G8F616_9CAUD|nr:exonuclease [Klebsiella phage kpssk3]AZF88829.1 exonuclease [Klebsiella phage kpssk3]QNN97256.1 exonuclease [Klebsiella phage NL_ZS_1]
MSKHTLLSFSDYRATQKIAKGVLVMDGDWLVFQAMSAAEFDASWEEEIWHRCCDHAKAREILENSIESYKGRKKAWKNADVVLAFTDRVNWRKLLVDPTYKENRAVVKKPVGYFEFLEYVFETYTCVLEPQLEGDDVMGIIGSNPLPYHYEKAVLVSCDKDFKTIPDCDFLWCTTGNILVQTQETADYWHLFQTIKGDITDGYGGIPGWGDTAEDFLKEPFIVEPVTSVLKSGKNKGQEVTKWVKRAPEAGETLWDCIKSIGAKAGMTEEEVIKQGQMARILRSDEYNIETGEITLWQPGS